MTSAPDRDVRELPVLRHGLASVSLEAVRDWRPAKRLIFHDVIRHVSFSSSLPPIAFLKEADEAKQYASESAIPCDGIAKAAISVPNSL